MNSLPKPAMPALAPSLERTTPEVCPECDGDDIVENWGQGTAECRSCGLVLQEKLLDLGSEWRTFAQEEGADPNRVGGPANPLLEGESGTGIGEVAPGSGRGVAGLSLTQKRNAVSAADRTMLQAIGRIDQLGMRMSLSGAMLKRAKELFKGYMDLQTMRDGVRLRGLREAEIQDGIAGAIFVACRNVGSERSFREVSGLTLVPRKKIGAAVKKIELAMPNSKRALEAKATDDLVTRFCTNLELSRELMNKTRILARSLNEGVLYGKTYTTVSACAVYVGALLSFSANRRPASRIAEVSGVAEATIKSGYKLIYSDLPKSMPPDLTFEKKISSLPSPRTEQRSS